MHELAPIVLFVYNRPKHTSMCLESLAENDLAGKSSLYIFADGPTEHESGEQLGKIKEVRKLIREKSWCKEIHIIESEKNKGLANSVITGVTEIVNKFGKIIVLEDDLVTSTGFLKYMNNALDLYAADERIMQVSGHNFPIENFSFNQTSFFLPMTTSWGWGTWSTAWKKFDFHSTGYEILKTDSRTRAKFDLDSSFPYSSMLEKQLESTVLNSWAIRWWWSVFKADGITLFPDKSLVMNIGFDPEGTHTRKKNPFPDENFDKNYQIKNFPPVVKVNEELFEKVKKCLQKSTSQNVNMLRLIFNSANKLIRQLKF